MSVRVIALVDDARDPLIAIAEDYLARAGRRYQASLALLRPEKRGRADDDAKVRAREGAALLRASEGATRVVLDVDGQAHGSEGFAEKLEKLLLRGRDVCFLVGGATGHADAVRAAADARWSLSSLTLPHRLAVVVVCEQIFRAHEIARGGPYHK